MERCPICNALLEKTEWRIVCSSNKCTYSRPIKQDKVGAYSQNQPDVSMSKPMKPNNTSTEGGVT